MPAHLGLEGLGVEPFDVVVAVVGEEEAAALARSDDPSRSASLNRTSLWPVMKRKGKA
jgi:hypothetical protein